MSTPVIADCRAEAIIDVPVAAINLAEWVFTLTDSEYRACSKDHIAAASSFAPDGRRMSINVERVGRLLVQHYVEDIAERRHCRLVSLSDTFGLGIFDQGRSDVTWESFVEALEDGRTRFTNRVLSRAVEGWEEAFERQGLTLEQVRGRSATAISAHNAEATPLFAKDIERKARERRWAAIVERIEAAPG